MGAGVKREKKAEKERKRSCVVAVVQRETGGENDRETDWGREGGRESAREREGRRGRGSEQTACCTVQHCVAAYFNVLQWRCCICIAADRSVLQCVAVRFSAL